MAITCPKCGYERGVGEQAPAGQCPSCGIIYAKYDPAVEKRRQDLAQLAEKRRARGDFDDISDEVAPPHGRGEAQVKVAANPEHNTNRDWPSQINVKVVDIEMSFWSMVKFMVKWAFASIPAVIIIVLLVISASAFVTGLMVGR